MKPVSSLEVNATLSWIFISYAVLIMEKAQTIFCLRFRLVAGELVACFVALEQNC
jgi:hypothetical protein